MNEYYFTVDDDGIATVMVISEDGSWSQHSSEDASLADGDGSLVPYEWRDAQRWSKTTREHANTMLQFELR